MIHPDIKWKYYYSPFQNPSFKDGLEANDFVKLDFKSLQGFEIASSN